MIDSVVSIEEMKEVEGGWLKTLVGVVVGYSIYLYDNRDRFVEGFKEAYN